MWTAFLFRFYPSDDGTGVMEQIENCRREAVARCGHAELLFRVFDLNLA
jgi:hypothetical protein